MRWYWLILFCLVAVDLTPTNGFSTQPKITEQWTTQAVEPFLRCAFNPNRLADSRVRPISVGAFLMQRVTHHEMRHPEQLSTRTTRSVRRFMVLLIEEILFHKNGRKGLPSQEEVASQSNKIFSGHASLSEILEILALTVTHEWNIDGIRFYLVGEPVSSNTFDLWRCFARKPHRLVPAAISVLTIEGPIVLIPDFLWEALTQGHRQFLQNHEILEAGSNHAQAIDSQGRHLHNLAVKVFRDIFRSTGRSHTTPLKKFRDHRESRIHKRILVVSHELGNKLQFIRSFHCLFDELPPAIKEKYALPPAFPVLARLPSAIADTVKHKGKLDHELLEEIEAWVDSTQFNLGEIATILKIMASITEDELSSYPYKSMYFSYVRDIMPLVIYDVQSFLNRLISDEEEPLEPIQLEKIILQGIAVQHERLQRYGHTLRFQDPSTHIPLISGQPTHLREVVDNLIKNAVEALPKNGGTISVNLAVDETCNEVVLSVSDTGHGIPKEFRKKIWTRGFTLKRGDFKGSGIGLPEVKKIIKHHGGRIIVDSLTETEADALSSREIDKRDERGQRIRPGTTFEIRFPIPSSQPLQHQAPDPMVARAA